jgi:CubicO group peptidase (beta-lactamase class C family)
MTRRGAVRALGFAAMGSAVVLSSGPPGILLGPHITYAQAQSTDPVLADLGDQVQMLMRNARVPGVAIGLRIDGQNHSSGWGITNLEYPRPVDGGTIFQVGSTTKTFTGTAAAILMERGLLKLGARVRQYLPELVLSDQDAADSIILQNLVTHTSGFFGDILPNNSRNDDGLAHIVRDVAPLPQITPLGRVFSYNNMAVGLEGRVVEVAAGKPYRDFITGLLLQPLGMTRSSFFLQDLVDYPVAAGHLLTSDGVKVERPVGSGIFSAATAPIGGLFSTADDLLRWAAFHLGDGRSADGTQLAAPETLANMQQLHGPGGALGSDDLDGVGINWLLRHVGQARVVEHGGTTNTHRTQFVMVPERDFALVILTNSPGGSLLRKQLAPWALEHFLGLRAPLPATNPAQAVDLGEYTSAYGVRGLGSALQVINAGGVLQLQNFGEDGSLEPTGHAVKFYQRDRVVLSGGDEEGNLVDFLRSDDGRVSWVRHNGRVLERV